MDYSRIASVVDTRRLEAAHVAVVGVGGSVGLIENLARCGVKRWTLIDPDEVEPGNVARQGYNPGEVGLPKVTAAARKLRAVRPDACVDGLQADFTSLGDAEIDRRVGLVDLWVFATDRFAAQARGNEVALRKAEPALWVGLYPEGRGGEVVFWHPKVNACYRCLTARRYEAHEKAHRLGRRLDPPSTGATVLDVVLVDAVAGHLALGLLTRGADNRFGRLIDRLGGRNFLQIKIDPDYTTHGRDVVGEHLGIEPGCDAYVGWNTVALRDPTAYQECCGDCARYRGDRLRAGRRIPGGPRLPDVIEGGRL